MWIILFCRTVINGGTRIVRCEVLTVVVVKTAVFLDVIPCSMVYINHIKSHHIPEDGSIQCKTVHYLCMLLVLKKVLFLKLIPIFEHYCYIMNLSLIFTDLLSGLCVCECMCVHMWCTSSFGSKCHPKLINSFILKHSHAVVLLFILCTFSLVYNTIVHRMTSLSCKNINNNSGRLTKFSECGKKLTKLFL